MQKYIIVFILLFLFTLVCCVYFITNTRKEKYHNDLKPIYCLMITGKDEARLKYARQSIVNFQSQDYAQKFLVIINHNKQPVLNSNPQSNVFEFYVEKHARMTLGGLRNIALQMVPIDAWWVTWDDDDYRSPTFLSSLAALKTASNLVAITRRLEYNTNTGVSWSQTHNKGFVIFLASIDHRISYENLDSMEDTKIIDAYKSNGYDIVLYNNDPKAFIRVVHSNNTSLFVRKNRTWLMKGDGYSETFTTDSEKRYIRRTLLSTYR